MSDGGYRRVTVGPPGQGVQWWEHRWVLFQKIGSGEHECHWCGRIVSWDFEYPEGGDMALIADHLDGDTLNNDPGNLVPACNTCNNVRQIVAEPDDV